MEEALGDRSSQKIAGADNKRNLIAGAVIHFPEQILAALVLSQATGAPTWAIAPSSVAMPANFPGAAAVGAAAAFSRVARTDYHRTAVIVT